MLKVLQSVHKDLRKVPVTLNNQKPSLCENRNTMSDGITLEAQLQLRVKFYLGDEMTGGIID